MFKANIQWLVSYLIRVKERSSLFEPKLLKISEEIRYLISHINRWVSDNPKENLLAVKHRIVLLFYLESQKSENLLRDEYLAFIQCIINSLKGKKLFWSCIGMRFERKLDDLFKGIKEDKLFTTPLKEYLKKLDAGFLSKNKKITEFIELEG